MHYSHAIVRLPADSCRRGLTTAGLGLPDLEETRRQFDNYVKALRELGLKVMVLPAEPGFPDSHFVEDTAVVVPEFALITRPGAHSRQGEVALIEPTLARFRPIERISERAHMDGGDVLLVGKRFFVGLSSRTDEAGIREFSAIVERYGYRVDTIGVGAGLHLKSIVNYVGRNTLMVGEDHARHPAFADFEHIVVSKEEEYAGNTLWINDTLITPAGFPDTHSKLTRLGLDIISIDTSEFRKMDGGLTCLSLRF